MACWKATGRPECARSTGEGDRRGQRGEQRLCRLWERLWVGFQVRWEPLEVLSTFSSGTIQVACEKRPQNREVRGLL